MASFHTSQSHDINKYHSMVTGSIYCGIYFNGFYYVYKSDRLHIPLVLSILMIKRGMLHVLYNLCNNFLTEKFGII